MSRRKYDRPRSYDPSHRRFENQNEKNESESPVEEKVDSVFTENKPSTFKVRVYIDNLNIRKGAGLSCPRTGKFTGPGVFTITEVENGFGKLESGEGWISLKFCEVIK